jgi:Ca-activated chloride channel family protein
VGRLTKEKQQQGQQPQQQAQADDETGKLNVNGKENLAVVLDQLTDAIGKPVETPNVVANRVLPKEYDGQIVLAPGPSSSPSQESGEARTKDGLTDLKVSGNDLRDKNVQRQEESGVKVAEGEAAYRKQPSRWAYTGKQRQQEQQTPEKLPGLIEESEKGRSDAATALRDVGKDVYWRNPTVRQGDLKPDGVGLEGPGQRGAQAGNKPVAGDAEKDLFLLSFDGDAYTQATAGHGREQAKAPKPTGHELELYDVRDLTTVINDFAAPRMEIQGGQTEAPSAAPGKDVIQQLKARLSPADFAEAEASIEEHGGKLVVMNRPEVQEKIKRALVEMRREQAAKPGGGEKAPWINQEFDEQFERQKEIADGNRIPHQDYLIYPSNWHEISKRAASDPKGKQIGASERTFRAFRHFHAENEKLAYAEFVRRPLPVPAPELTDEGLDEDAFIERYGYRPFVDAARDHLSTFGMDVDTASYTQARAALREGRLPEPASVRTEEFVNYFKQPYEVAGDETFGVFAEGMPSPFGCAAGLELVKIGIKSRAPRPDERKPAALTFVVDTSGSMGREDEQGLSRLALLRSALRSLVASLSAEDSVCIVGFNDQAEVVVPRTQARFAARILDGLNRLSAGGGTNLEAGLNLGYRLADEAFSPEAVNRVVLCGDGVANVGQQGPDELLKLVQVFAARGIDLAAVGLGLGQYNDAMMQKLADSGNGSAHFVDTPQEAEKVFREQLPPHLGALARDAKVQVDFNPEVVARYRLLGYEKRKIADQDFRNDKIDSGEVGHATLVTALYEIQRRPNANGPLGKVYLRWKDASRRHLPVVERNFPLGEGLIAARAEAAPADLRFLACVAQFAELLRGNRWARTGSFAAVLRQLERLPDECRARAEWNELADLVRRAQALSVQCWAEDVRPQDKR